MDFQKNLPLPNISTNDVYFKSNLSVFSFHIHQISNSRALFHAHIEIIGKKDPT